MNSVKQFITLLGLQFLIITNLGAKLPNLRLLDPYLSEKNQSYTALSWNLVDLGPVLFHAVSLDLSYGVNEKLQVGLYAPYLYTPAAPGAGVLGDIAGDLKFVISQSDTLTWRLIGNLHFRFPTGVKETDADINVAGVIFNYFPFTSGTGQMSPSVLFSWLTKGWIFAGGVTYQLENNPDAPLLEFDLNYDRVDIALYTDYFFKIRLSEKEQDIFVLRPALYMEYRLNLSPLIHIPDGLYTTVELNFKWARILRGRVGINFPIYSAGTLHNYHTYIELGKNF